MSPFKPVVLIKRIRQGVINNTDIRLANAQWAEFPFKKDWDWMAESKLKDQKGKWKCSEAMERYAARMKSKPAN